MHAALYSSMFKLILISRGGISTQMVFALVTKTFQLSYKANITSITKKIKINIARKNWVSGNENKKKTKCQFFSQKNLRSQFLTSATKN